MLALFAYNRAANRCLVWDVRIGGCVAILTALVGTSIFATLDEEPGLVAKIAVGLVSVTAAVASGIQAFAGMPQRIEDYLKAARRYGAIRRDIEQLRAAGPSGGPIAHAELTRIRRSLDDAAESSPNAPRRVWERTRRHMKGEFTYLERLADRIRGLPPRDQLGLHPDDLRHTEDRLGISDGQRT